MLKSGEWKLSYNSSEHDITKDFILPAIIKSKIYKRGVGYFTSGWITCNAKGLAVFVENGGKIQFITSPIIDEKDLEALSGKFDPKIVDKALIENIGTLEKYLKEETRNLLGWLVHDGLLEFKFAVPKNHLKGGEFHDKFGVFIDENDEIVAFNGSMNDSIKGCYNYESITVFRSWGDETSRAMANDLLKRFEILWENKNPHIEIYEMPDLVKKRLIKLKKYNARPYLLPFNTPITKDHQPDYLNAPFMPSWLQLRSYQKEAINSWIKNKYRGILSMATGSGKTITALTAVTHLYSALKTNNITFPLLVVVPYLHLLEQWSKEAEKFGIKFIKCSSDYTSWEKEVSEAITDYVYGSEKFLAIITTIGTYRTSRFINLLSKLKNIFLLVDEVHNFGAPEIRKKYLENTRFRLGLSATPERYMDDEGSKAIVKYFEGIAYSYTLKNAIDDGNLTKYYYYPIFVSLQPDEEAAYIELTEKIIKMVAMGHDIDDPDSALKTLLLQRAKIIATAKNKIVALENTLLENNLIHTKHNLFYVAAHIERSESDVTRMIDKVIFILQNLGMQVDKFTADENNIERKYLIDKLTDGYINGLVAIKCLDEGVDIPSVERAFIMASSSNPKEFIQRRGRVLRRSPSTGKQHAYIYDFLVLPDLTDSSKFGVYADFERKYIEKELKRYQEFAELAINAHEVESKILEIKQYYRLLHI